MLATRLFIASFRYWLMIKTRPFRIIHQKVLKNRTVCKPVNKQISLHHVIGYIHQLDRWTTWKQTCLVKSLVAKAVLPGYGHEATIVLGIKKLPGKLEAHAWIESGGQKFFYSEIEHQHFKEIYRA